MLYGVDLKSEDLAAMKCRPCTTSDLLGKDKAAEYISLLPSWHIENGSVCREFKFKDFSESMKFINSLAKVAEEQDHHPDIEIHWNRVKLSLITHAIKGLSINDFVMAAKIDRI